MYYRKHLYYVTIVTYEDDEQQGLLWEMTRTSFHGYSRLNLIES